MSLSVSVVAEIPASGPRLGREPAVTEGSGICPGIASGSAFTAAVGAMREKRGRHFQTAMKAGFMSQFTSSEANVGIETFFFFTDKV